MTEFRVLMAIPKREQHHSIINFFQEKTNMEGILRYTSCNEDISEFTYVIEDTVDTLTVHIVEDCKKTHDILSKSWSKYHCIVFDLEEQCFTKTFFEHKKDIISQKLPVVTLVPGTSEDFSFNRATIKPDKEKNIIEIDKSERSDNILKVIIRLVQKPEITFVLPESIRTEEMVTGYKQVFRNVSDIKYLANDDGKLLLESEFQYPSKTNFFIYLININKRFDNINHLYQMMNSNESFYSVILCGDRPDNFTTFFPKKISELPDYLNSIKNDEVTPVEVKEILTTRYNFLLGDKYRIRSCFGKSTQDFNFSKSLYFSKEIIYAISKKMFDSCSYLGVIGNRDAEESKKLISELIPKQPEESKMGNTFNISHVEKFAGRDFYDHSHTEIHNDYRLQIASIANQLENSHALSESEKEVIGKLNELLASKSESSESRISKIGSALKSIIGTAKDAIPSLNFILEHKGEIMAAIERALVP